MRKTYKKKRNLKRRGRRAVLYRKPKSLTPGIFSFKRSWTEVQDVVQLTANGWSPSTTTGNQGIGKTFTFSLNDINDKSDFVNLFKYYRIKAVRVQMYWSNNVTSQDEPSRFPNSQLLVYTDINQNGVTTGNNDIYYYLDSQTAKRKVAITTDRKPIDMLMRVKQANEVYQSVSNSDYTLMSPKFISTEETGTPHYGMNMFIGRVDGKELSAGFTNTQAVRFVYTYYIQCKKVQ